jgi:hypothetical protein
MLPSGIALISANTKRNTYNKALKKHKKIHLSADAVQWYSCDKCDYKTKRNCYLTQHKKIHLSADAIHWYSCDKCDFKTKWNHNSKQHKKIHLSRYYLIIKSLNIQRSTNSPYNIQTIFGGFIVRNVILKQSLYTT